VPKSSPQYSEQEINNAILKEYPNAKNIVLNQIVSGFLEGQVYYAKWDPLGPDDFCYAFCTSDGILIREDGEAVIREFKTILDQRRTLWQRVGEFTLTEFVAAIIALIVTGTFVYLSIHNDPGAAINTQFLGIFSLVAGYYFGKNVTK